MGHGGGIFRLRSCPWKVGVEGWFESGVVGVGGGCLLGTGGLERAERLFRFLWFEDRSTSVILPVGDPCLLTVVRGDFEDSN
jgi:hypothetical protein